MQLRISSQHLVQLRLWADAAGKRECCGLIFGTADRVEALQLAANVAENPERNFEIDPAALIAAEKAARAGGRGILGYFHSHPCGTAEPSARDAKMAANDGRIWMIVGPDQIAAWLPVADGLDNVGFEPVQFSVEG